MKNISNNTIIVGIVGLIVGLLVGWFIGDNMADKKIAMDQKTAQSSQTSSMMDSNMMDDKSTSSMMSGTDSMMMHDGEAAILVVDQGAGSVATVASVETDDSVWVAVRENSNGVLGKILGASRVDAGASNNIVVNLLRPTMSGKTYSVVLYADDGDRMFDHKKDVIMSSGGKVISQDFTVSAQ